VKEVVVAVFVSAVLSLPLEADAWSGNFEFVANQGSSQFAQRLREGVAAHVEMHGLIAYVNVMNRRGKVEKFVSRAWVMSLDCKNEATFRVITEDKTEILLFHLTLEDSDDRPCLMFKPSDYQTLSIASFDVNRSGEAIARGMTVFEVHQSQIDRRPPF
jgi:hypothetical protein